MMLQKDQVIHFRVPTATKKTLKERAKNWNMSLSAFCLKKVLDESWQRTELSHLQRELYRLRGLVAKIGGLYKADVSAYQGLDPRRSDLKKALLNNQNCQSNINNLIDQITHQLRSV